MTPAHPDTPMRILVVDDERPIRRFLRIALEASGYKVDEAETGRIGLSAAATGGPDAILLDLGLPDIDGKKVVTAIREWSRVPILILSVRDAEAEKIAALDAGADDYITKPFAIGELLARLRASLRNRSESATDRGQLQFGPLAIDVPNHVVSFEGKPVKLTRKEFAVLAMLARNAGRLVGHRQLLSTIWGPAHVEDIQYLRIVVGHLREKLGDDAADPRFIVTEPGVGYRFLIDSKGESDPPY